MQNTRQKFNVDYIAIARCIAVHNNCTRGNTILMMTRL